MTGYDSDHGQELWVSDGNGAPFTLLRDIAPGSRSSLPQYLTVVDDFLLFSANDDSHGRELWISDGTEAGTRMIWEQAQGGFSSAPSNLSVVGQDLLFTAFHPRIGREQWILHLGTGADGRIFDDDFESGTAAQWEEPTD
jgi:ELWxxDGT repeat protein